MKRKTRLWARVMPRGAVSGLLVPLMGLIVIASFVSPHFLSLQNAETLVRSVSTIGIMALGTTVVLISGELDISIGSIAALSVVAGASFLKTDSSSAVILVTLATGTLAGIANGLGVVMLRVPSLIMTLGTLAIFRAVGNIVSTGHQSYPNHLSAYLFIGRGDILGVSFPVFIFLAIGASLIYTVRFSSYGRRLYSVGSNAHAAALSGIRPSSVKVIALALNGLCAAIAGLIQSAQVAEIDPAMGHGYELIAIAIAVLGGASLFGGRGTIAGAMLGALVIGVLNNVLNLLGWSGSGEEVFVAIIIILTAWAQGFYTRGAQFSQE